MAARPPLNHTHMQISGRRKAVQSCAKAFFGSTSITLLLLALLPTCSQGYNIDLPSYVRHTREANTMFGFSIALHKGKSGHLSNSVVVGAPKFDTSSFQPGVEEGGAVFRCGMADDDCSLVRFDSTGNRKNTDHYVIERKSHQWLGATVATGRDNDFIVACAPRYIFHTMSPNTNLRYDPVGTCFTSRNFLQFKEVSPCRTNYWGYHRQGSCQAGFSAAVSRNGERLYVGAPGSWYWQGQAYSILPDATFPYKPSYYQPFGTGGQTYSYDVTRPENQVYSTAESSSHDDDSYLGYSMAVGDFNADGVDDVAIGMPRGAGLLGKIVVNNWNLSNILNITGRQIGEYFGYALASSDVDGDGFDDLIIGAPMYSESGNAEGKYDVGRVYVLLQGGRNQDRWAIEHIRDGYRSKGRFGQSLSTLGDINRDGYGDFAVGAPYDGPDGRGAVYIFHGSALGPLLKPSQIIHAEDLGTPYPRTFGFALAGGLDMDGNTYPDLAVGSYDSSQVYVFKSRPVAAVEASTTFLNPSKLINLEERHCQTVRDGKRVACTDITSCWSYTGEYLPGNLEFDVSWVLDAKKTKNPRMFFLLDEGRNIRNLSISLPYGKTYCRNETVYLLDSLQDKLTPLEVEMRYNLRSNNRLLQQPFVRRRREALEPVIDQNREIVQRDAINIQKNCGADNICEPDLRLEIQTVDKYLLGSRQPLIIDVLITNANEDAFEAAFYMVIPKDLDYKQIRQIGDKSEQLISCTAPSQDNNHTLKCDIGNPLQSGKVANFKVILLPSQRVGMAPSYDFIMEANSTNPERAGSHFDNIIRKSIGLWVQTDPIIKGNSVPDFQYYKAADFKAVENATSEEDLGPQVVHIYNIRNNGPSTIEEAVVLIHYPYATLGGDLLMYMTNQPEIAGNIVCDPHLTVNSLNLKIDQNLARKSYLEQTDAAAQGHAYGFSGTHIERTGSSSSSAGASSGSSSHAVAIGGGTKMLSEAEKRRLETEDKQAVSGDASFVHTQRANAAAEAAERYGGSSSGAAGSGSGGSGSYSWSSSWNTTGGSGSGVAGAGRAPASIIVSTRNSSVVYDASGRPHVVETSTEYVTNLENVPGYYRQQQGQQSQQQQQHAANYQHAAGEGNLALAGIGGNRGGRVGGSESRRYQSSTQSQQQAQPQPKEQSASGHSARGHIQIAGEPVITSSRSYSSQQNAPGSVYRGAQRTGNAGFSGNANYNFEKTAQGGQGFHAGTLDLGALNRGNVDNELRQHGASGAAAGAGAGAGGSQNYQQKYYSSSSVPRTSAAGGAVGAGNYHQSSYSSSSGGNLGGGKPYYGMEDEDYYDDENAQQTAGGQQWSHTASSSSGSQRRFRRESAITEPSTETYQIDLNSPCKKTKCETLRCVASNLGKDEDVWIAVRVRMVAKTMEKLADNVPLNTSTMAVVYVTRLPFIGEPKDEIIKSHEIIYQAVPEKIAIPTPVPLWAVVLAACAGALILLLLIFLLYKCGFFNRNRPTDHSQERQPLRNGYHGDEHL